MRTGDDRPSRREKVEVRDRNGTPTLVGPTGKTLARLNEAALAVWDLCDGETSIDEMVAAVVELSAVAPERAQADVSGALDAFESVGGLSDSR